MRTNKDTFRSLNDAVKGVVSGTNEIEESQKIEEQEGIPSALPDINNLADKDIADYIIRYNQIVNRALRARFMTRSKRKAV